jgi:flagellar biosynthesis GTPase FlhF
MGYKGRDVADRQEHFLRFIESLKLPYFEIDYTHPLAIEYPSVQQEAKLIPKQIEQKRWICMAPRDFKKVVMRLNTKNSDVVRDYYLNLEEAMFAYGEYTMKYMIESTTQSMQYQLALRDAQVEEAERVAEEERQRAEEERQRAEEERQRAEEERLQREEAERIAEEERLQREEAEVEAKKKLEKALKFNQATKPVEPQEYIYVVTTDRYIPENKYKPGGAASFNLLKSRMTAYNCGKSDSDLHKPVYLRKVVSLSGRRTDFGSVFGCVQRERK